MKNLFLLLTFLPMVLFSQKITIDEKTGLYSQTGVLEFEGKSQDDLFNKAIEWVTLNYNSANDVIQLKDKETGKIIVKGIMVFPESWNQTTNINHTLIIELKENKARCTYTSLSGYSNSATGNIIYSSNFENAKVKILNYYIEITEKNTNISIQSFIDFINAYDSDDW